MTIFEMNLFFFFQAEDVIRYIGVTGVQTCALPICEALLPYARRVLAEVERAGQVLGGLRELRGGRVAVGLTPSAVVWLLPELLAHYRRQHPLVQIQVIEDMTDRLVEFLHDGRLDLALVSLPVEDDALTVRALFEERLAVVVGPDHRLAGAAEVD